MDAAVLAHEPRAATWKLAVAFGVVYVAWGTTYLAIREGVQSFPPALFGGMRIATAGMLLFTWLWWRREKLSMPVREFIGNAVVGCILFVGGNGLITFGERTVPSGAASILVASTPIWMALLENLLPHGSRLAKLGWVGLFLGMSGVLVVLAPELEDPTVLLADYGPLLVLGSSACWSVGSVLARYQKRSASHLVAAACQMLAGGTVMTVIGLAIGETRSITAASFEPAAVYSFFHLLLVGSLLGFLTYNWLLRQVSAASAGTYAFVNPVLAVFAGWLIVGETPTVWLWVGLSIILAGVALVRVGGLRGHEPISLKPRVDRKVISEEMSPRSLATSTSRM
jgi:drug/metabolite transporter (DMT)-like permease